MDREACRVRPRVLDHLRVQNLIECAKNCKEVSTRILNVHTYIPYDYLAGNYQRQFEMLKTTEVNVKMKKSTTTTKPINTFFIQKNTKQKVCL